MEDIKVVIEHADEGGRNAKCLRCWKFTPECAYDQRKGCINLLCRRCAEVVAEEFPNDPTVINFYEERKRIYK